MVERDCHLCEDGSVRDGQVSCWGASVLPGARLCSCFPASLQWLWLAWCVVKLIQLSGGLFLAQSALHITAAQRALLSCCSGCCWFGEAGASPWLCPHSHPLSQPTHRLFCFNHQPQACACLPSEDIFILLSMHGYQRAHCCCCGTAASLQAVAVSPTGPGSQKELSVSMQGEEGRR